MTLANVVRRGALAGGLAIGLVLPGSPAMAAAGDCSSELSAVRNAIEVGQFEGKRADTDQLNLLSTLDNSVDKVAQNKYDDAITKLHSISDKAVDLATAAKPKLLDATAITTAVTDAVDCISGL